MRVKIGSSSDKMYLGAGGFEAIEGLICRVVGMLAEPRLLGRAFLCEGHRFKSFLNLHIWPVLLTGSSLSASHARMMMMMLMKMMKTKKNMMMRFVSCSKLLH